MGVKEQFSKKYNMSVFWYGIKMATIFYLRAEQLCPSNVSAKHKNDESKVNQMGKVPASKVPLERVWCVCAALKC